MAATRVRAMDLLFNITGASIGRCAIAPDDFDEGNVSQHVCIVRLADPAFRHFVHLALISNLIQSEVMNVQVGISREGLSTGRFKEFLIPIPPLAEQHRIVARVDELMALLDRLEAKRKEREAARSAARDSSLAALRDAPTLDDVETSWLRIQERLTDLFAAPGDLEPFREAVLQLGVRGRLEAQDSSDEPANLLLSRIHSEKRKLASTGKIKIEKESQNTKKLNILFDLPNNWSWTEWHTIAYKIGDIDHQMPESTTLGVPFVSPRDFLPNNKINFAGAKLISIDDFIKLSKKIKPEVGDLIYPRYGTIGENRLVTDNREFIVSYSCAIIKTLTGFIDPLFQYYYSISPLVKFQAKAAENKTTQANVGLKSIKSYLVPLPPYKEQQRIAKTINSIMSKIDRLEEMLGATSSHSKLFASAAVHHLDV